MIKQSFEPIRITDLDICCCICGKNDWCCVSSDGGFAFCPRIEEGSIGQYGAFGYIHKIKPDKRLKIGYRKVKSKSKYKINWELLQEFYENYHSNEPFPLLGQAKLGFGWDGKATTVSIFNETRNIVGIQRIFSDGTKIMVKGSKDGIFWPKDLKFNGYLLICEGASDTIAALNLEFEAIGRLSCNNGIKIICKLLKKEQNCKPIIISDNDKAGIDGAKKLAIALLDVNPASIIIPYYKDLRETVEKGFTKNDLLKQIKVVERCCIKNVQNVRKENQ